MVTVLASSVANSQTTETRHRHNTFLPILPCGYVFAQKTGPKLRLS